jgi:Cytochrome P460
MTRLLAVAALLAVAMNATAADHEPRYTADGRLDAPGDYREWIYLSSGLDMSYRERMDMGHSMFDNVFASPEAYRSFLKTGVWPDKTVLVMEVRGASDKGSINVSGKFQTSERMGFEAHVKDSARFAGGWGFFAFDDDAPAPLLPPSAACYACHQQHGAVDTTFVQFYPTLLGIATDHGTLSAAFRDEEKNRPKPPAAIAH